MTGQEDPHSSRLFTPGVAVLLGFVVVIGNPWLNRGLTVALSDAEAAFRLVNVLFSYPRWHVDIDLIGPFLFWFLNVRTLLLVLLVVAGLSRMSRWTAETGGRTGLLITTVGLTTLSAVTAGLVSAVLGVTLLNSRETRPYLSSGQPDEFFLIEISSSATFGVLFGLVLGAVVALQRRAATSGQRRASSPKSLW